LDWGPYEGDCAKQGDREGTGPVYGRVFGVWKVLLAGPPRRARPDVPSAGGAYQFAKETANGNVRKANVWVDAETTQTPTHTSGKEA